MVSYRIWPPDQAPNEKRRITDADVSVAKVPEEWSPKEQD